MKTLFSSESRKAWLAAGIALAGALTVAAHDDVITLAEWLNSASVTLVALGGVYGIRNADQK